MIIYSLTHLPPWQFLFEQYRAYSSCFKLFKFCTFLPKFSNTLPSFALVLPFFWFFSKIACMPLLSKIGPAEPLPFHYYKYLSKKIQLDTIIIWCGLLEKAGFFRFQNNLMRLNSTIWHNNTKNLDHTVTAITSKTLF